VDGHGRSAWLFLPIDSDDRSAALDQYSMAMAAIAFSFAPPA
jgi:hypothetical protein